MKEIRILVEFDNTKPKYDKFKETFIVDEKTIQSLGNDDSADTLSEYDAIVLSFEKPITFSQVRIEQLINFLKKENKLLVFILNKHAQGSYGSNTSLIGSLITHFGGKNNEFVKLYQSGKKFEATDEAKKSIFFEYLKTKDKVWRISFKDVGYDFIISLAKNTDEDLVAKSIT